MARTRGVSVAAAAIGAVLGGVLSVVASAEPARAASLVLDLDAYSGGLTFGHGSITIALDPPATNPALPDTKTGAGARYDARLAVEAAGWLALFTKFRYGAEAHGTLGAGRLEAGAWRPGESAAVPARPERFRGERRLRSKQDVMTLTYGPDGVEPTAQPPQSPEKTALVPPDRRRDSIDPLTAGAAIVLTAGRAGGCAGTYPVYDGRRRYDLILAPRGTETLEPSRYRLYAGAATVCGVTLRPVAGFQRDLDPKKYFAQGEDRHATVWFAPAGPGGRAIPVMAEVPTFLGTVIVQTSGAREAG